VSFEDLVAKSDQIVTGTVGRSWTSWGSEKKLIWTRYEIHVEDVIKGVREKTVIVSEPGGSLEGHGMRVEGAVPYEAGEHVTLFLESYPSGDKRTVGWTQGKFTWDAKGRVHPGSAGGRVELNLNSLRFSATPLAALSGITSEELRRRIMSLSKARGVQ
jgi:hypothetical protein